MFYTLATCIHIHVHELQTTNRLKRPLGGGGELNSEQGVTAMQYSTCIFSEAMPMQASSIGERGIMGGEGSEEGRGGGGKQGGDSPKH